MIDDDARVREVVVAYLIREGYLVLEAGDADEARRHLAGPTPDLVILDVMLPGASGLDLLGELRQTSSLPVILLTARAGEVDRIQGLELGADDYVVKPFSPRELVARVRSVLRRSRPEPQSAVLRFNGILVDTGARMVQVGEHEVELTAREFDLIAFLASHPGQVFSRAQLLEQVWDSSTDWQDPATVTVHVRRVRQKIENDPADPRWLQTAWGVGYRFHP